MEKSEVCGGQDRKERQESTPSSKHVLLRDCGWQENKGEEERQDTWDGNNLNFPALLGDLGEIDRYLFTPSFKDTWMNERND